MEKLKKVNEKSKIFLIIGVAVGIILLFLIPVFVGAGDKVEISEGDLRVTYDSVFNTAVCIADIALSKDAEGDVVAEFYDAEDNIIETAECRIVSENKSAKPLFIVMGRPTSFKIVDSSLKTETVRVLSIVFDTLGIIAIIIVVLWVPYRKKSAEVNGHQITVLSGLFKNYYVIDGEAYFKFGKFFATENLILNFDDAEIIVNIDSLKKISFLGNFVTDPYGAQQPTDDISDEENPTENSDETPSENSDETPSDNAAEMPSGNADGIPSGIAEATPSDNADEKSDGENQ